MKNIAVVIRTFSRVDDVKALVEIIQKFWNSHNYSLFIAFNGASAGYSLDTTVYKEAEVIEIPHNSGHYLGASELVMQAYEHIKERDFDYVLFVESDFWLLNEALIQKGIEKNKDLSTTIWVEKRSSLAVDFFLIKKDVLDKFKDILDWGDRAEINFKTAVNKAGMSVYIFNELRSVHAPGLLKLICKKIVYTYAYGGRFKLFYKAHALSHHTEELYDTHYTGKKDIDISKEEKMQIGMHIKKAIANTMLGEEFFKDCGFYEISFFEKHAPRISMYIPQNAWLRKIF